MRTMKGGGRLDPSAFVPPIVHPVKVAILRTLAARDEPLEAAELARAVDHPATTAQIAYHALTLAQHGAVESVVDHDGGRPTRRYRLAPREPT